MCKKINEDAIAIKRLIASGEFTDAEIAKLLGISRQKVYYWAHTDFKMIQKRRKNLANFTLIKSSS